MASTCEYWDCGWCYHPDINIGQQGCIGFTECPVPTHDIIATDSEEEVDD